MNEHYPAVAEHAAHHCEYCHAPEAVFNLPFEVEHIIPRARGGADEERNWALACRVCNLRKSSRVDGVDSLTGQAARLFHPRQDRWDEHFRVDIATCEIIGRTPTGRVTVACLQLNAPLQLAARRQWMRLGLYPPA